MKVECQLPWPAITTAALSKRKTLPFTSELRFHLQDLQDIYVPQMMAGGLMLSTGMEGAFMVVALVLLPQCWHPSLL